MLRFFHTGLVLMTLAVAAGAAKADTESSNTGNPAPAAATPSSSSTVATLDVADLKEYTSQSDVVKRLIDAGLVLTRLGLSYQYGSSDPKNGGMDCSGTVYYLLNQAGLKDVPRDASEMYAWVWKQSRFQAVLSPHPGSFEFDRLQPGDLLFWTGTYHVDRDPPITHVMIYLGTNRQTGRRVMLGASEGRRFNEKSRYGVSVFDFEMPRPRTSSAGSDSESRFVGYGAIPGLEEVASKP
jgi:cell wall-associated NlpC family hydrolase